MDNPPISDIDRLDDGVVVTYSDGTVLFFAGEFLWKFREDALMPIPKEKPPE